MNDLANAHEQLIADQFPHGEWGRCEHDGHMHDMEGSRAKPNFFTSSEAALSLVATGKAEHEALARYLEWVDKLRAEDGWWHSAAGASAPGRHGQSWVRNIRHTAKGLDVRALAKRLAGDDLITIRAVLEQQLDSGSYPQFPASAADIWSTLYTMNLLITVLRLEQVRRLTCPMKQDLKSWELSLRTRLDRAHSWIVDQLEGGERWQLSDQQREPVWVTQAVVIEAGADLALNRPDICRFVAGYLENCSSLNDPRTLWGLLAMWPGLTLDQQRAVTTALAELEYQTDTDSLSMACRCRLLALNGDPLLAQYYFQIAHGHSAALADWKAWASGEYARWCVRTITDASCPTTPPSSVVATKVDLWLRVRGLIEHYRSSVEQRGDWRMLWQSDGSPIDEKQIQQHFLGITRSIAERWGVLQIREPETGHGPIDFEFANGVRARIHVEFKRLDHARLEHGLMQQLPTYMMSGDVDSGLFVCLGFNDTDCSRYESRVKAWQDKLRRQHENFWIEAIYVDGRTQKSASRR